MEGEDGVLLRLPGEDWPPFRFPEKGRKNDHSDSNWIVSDSEPNGAYVKMVSSSNWSIRRSANRMMKTKWIS